MITNNLCSIAITNPLKAFTCINEITYQYFGVAILMIIWLVIYASNSRESTRDAIVGASTVCFVICMMFMVSGMVTSTYVYSACLVLFAGSIALVVFRPSNGG